MGFFVERNIYMLNMGCSICVVAKVNMTVKLTNEKKSVCSVVIEGMSKCITGIQI